VTVLVVLLWVQALFGIGGGGILIIEHEDADLIAHAGRSSDALLAIGVALLVVGLLTAWLAWALGGASNFARWLVAIVAILHLAGAVYSLIALDGVTLGAALFNGVVAVVVLYILFGERGSEEFFAG
jgi:uncharacterized membrane protein (DUF2068 family)